jgi:hypothetical protein
MRKFLFSIPALLTLLLACSSGTGSPSGGGGSSGASGSSGVGGSSGVMSSGGGPFVGPPYFFPASCTVLSEGCPIYVCECDDLSRSYWYNSIPGSSPGMCSVPTTACDSRCSFGGTYPIKTSAIRCISDEEFVAQYPGGRHPGEACNPAEGMVTELPRTCVFGINDKVTCPGTVGSADSILPLKDIRRPCPPDTKVCPTIADMTAILCKAP